ncbi:hypothetical protein MMC19_004069 [Ptychographa xylographoides]|nr:hypothetical protein [Ptychographa xylographoides]
MKYLSTIGAVCGLVRAVYGDSVVKTCPQSGICYSVNVPSTSASSGNGDLYFQIQAPSSLQWVGLGQGQQMAGANIFIIYANQDGNNVTLSPRLGAGNYQPSYDQNSAQASLLDGTGIANGVMTANVRCANCASWNGGSMSFTDSASSWIWAAKNGDPIASNDPSANLNQHDYNDNFQIDLTKAAGGNSLNPFVSNAATTSTAPAGSSPSSSSPSSSGGSTGGSSNGGSSGGSSDSGEEATKHMRVIAHGIIMSLAFLIFFPFGALTVRFLSVKGTVWIHAVSQLLAYALALAGMGIGVWLAVTEDMLNIPHPIIGLTVISGLFLQPFLGLIHHFIYRKSQRRTIWATGHVWWGRALLLLGAINGGLGTQLSDNTMQGQIAYGSIGAIVFLIYVTVVTVAWMRTRGSRGGETGEKLGSRNSPRAGSRSRETMDSSERGYGNGRRVPSRDRRGRTYIEHGRR